VILCEGGLITSEHLPLSVAAGTDVQSAPPVATPSSPLSINISSAAAANAAAAAAATAPGPHKSVSPPAAAARALILQALARPRTGNTSSKPARRLGPTRARLRSRIEKHGLDANDCPPSAAQRARPVRQSPHLAIRSPQAEPASPPLRASSPA